MINGENIYKNTCRLVTAPSVSGTADEVSAAYKIQEMLYEIPYFNEHKENVFMVHIEGDPFGRTLIGAYLEMDPGNPNTVILTGHYDVVDIEEYGDLKDIAYDVESITARIGELPIDDSTKADLASGEWIFGRGTADMKFGHAICLELMKHYSELGSDEAFGKERAGATCGGDCATGKYASKPAGNILYVGVCGEETNSEGMLAAVEFFNDFAAERGLVYKAMLVAECFMVDKEDDGTKYIQYDASGKFMPMFFCVGASTHGEEPLLGLDANLLNSEVFALMHLNPEFCQTSGGITSALPACLKQQDLKENYSLSSSLYAASYYNIATLKLNPEETMEKLVKLAGEAFDNANALVEKKVLQFETVSGHKPACYKAETCVKTFKEVYALAKAGYDGDFDKYIKEYAETLLAENPELQDTSIKLVKRVYEMSGDKRPMIIVSILPPYYPDVNMDMDNADAAHLMKCVDDVIDYAQETYGEKLAKSQYYGISDLCYSWLAEGADFSGVFDNLVGSGIYYNFPAEAMKKFKVPGIVLGGYGKDLHKYTERLHVKYNFEVLPDLYDYIIRKILG